MKIGVLGFGFVGKAVVVNMTPHTSVSCDIYDPAYTGNQYTTDKDKMLENRILILCLPTPFVRNGQDFSVMGEWLDYLVENNYKGIVCIKSTSLYKNVQPYLDKLTIVMNPEFLNARTAIEDFKNQEVLLLGSNDILAAKKVERMYESHFNLPHLYRTIFTTPEKAITVKYISNLYHAYKCTFWNMVQENTGVQADLFDMYATIWDRDKKDEMAFVETTPRGWGGACWKKDSEAINSVWQNPVIVAMLDYNESLQK